MGEGWSGRAVPQRWARRDAGLIDLDPASSYGRDQAPDGALMDPQGRREVRARGGAVGEVGQEPDRQGDARVPIGARGRGQALRRVSDSPVSSVMWM